MLCGCAFASSAASPRLPFEIKNIRASSPQLPKTRIRISPFDDLLNKAPAIKVSLPSHVTSITSTSNPFVKHCLKLRQSSSYRNTHGSVLVVGTVPISEVCMFQVNKQGITNEIDCLLLHEEAQIPPGLESSSVRIVRVSSVVMKKLSGVQSTESVEAIALMRIPNSFIDLKDDEDNITDCNKWFPSAHRVLVLDSIQDPGNLGTLIRTAMAFNWDGVFLLPGCCDAFNDKALRASRGASFQLPIVSGNWNHLKLLEQEFNMKLLAGHPATTSHKSKPVSKLSLEFVQSLREKPVCLILGSEGYGLSEQSRQVCELVSIPMTVWFRYKGFIVSLYGFGTKNSRAVRSGTPISHNVGPFLGGLYTTLPRLIFEPEATLMEFWCVNSPIKPGTHPYRLRKKIRGSYKIVRPSFDFFFGLSFSIFPK